MTATAPQTPRRSKRHHPIVFTAGSPPSHPKPRHDKWASLPLHSRDAISADLIDDEESIVDASTTFYPYFIRPSRTSEKLSKVASVKFFYRRQYFSQQVFEGQVWAVAAPARPSALLLTCPGRDRYSQMFVKSHRFLRPIELARSPMKREHLELSLLIVRFPYLKTN